MQNNIFLSDDLQTVLDRKSSAIGITTAAFITDFLEQSFKDELNGVPSKSYVQLYSELRASIINYTNTLNSGSKFTLHDVPYYKNLGVTAVVGTHSIPTALRARLGRSFNDEIRVKKPTDLNRIKRAVTKSGKPAFDKSGNTSAAIYEII